MGKITITNPNLKWLFGGLGFHNSEATMADFCLDFTPDKKGRFNVVSVDFWGNAGK